MEKVLNGSGNQSAVQRFGRFLSSMVMPNIGAFIAWGIITALFIPTGWTPNESLSKLVGPMIIYLLPILIGYTGGKLVGGARGAVVGAVATMGVVVGVEIPMFIGAMIMGPLGGFAIKKFDEMVDGNVPSGFEMLVANFSSGIIAMLLALLAYLGIGPVVLALNNVLKVGVETIVNANMLPFTSLFIEPGKILFLNNAINHGVLGPLGIQQAADAGKSIFFLLEANPGPGLGILLAYWVFAKGMVKQSAPGAVVIHFLGGIHEIYFPYVLMNPALLLAVIAGGMSGVFTFSVLGAGLIATPSPGSIIAVLAMTPKNGFIPVIAGVLVSTAVSFVVAAYFVKKKAMQEDLDLENAKMRVSSFKSTAKGTAIESLNTVTGLSSNKKFAGDVKKIVVACDAGMGSSAMAATTLKRKLKNAGVDIEVMHASIEDIPSDADIVITHVTLAERAKVKCMTAELITIDQFVGNPIYDELTTRLKNKQIG